MHSLPENKKIEINGLTVNYEESGPKDGVPVVLLHGWGCSTKTVRSIASFLEDSLRVISIDLPGHGSSEEPSTVWNTEDFACLIIDTIKKLDLHQPYIIGHSFGGRTAIKAAAISKPDFFRRIILVDSAGIKPRRSLKYYYKVYSYKTFKKLAFLFAGKEKGQKLVDKALKKSGSADYQAASPMMRAIMSRCVNEDLKKDMPHISVPTLLIWGEDDTATPISDAQKMKKLIPDSGLVSFPGCGHYSFLDNPFAFKAVIRKFLVSK